MHPDAAEPERDQNQSDGEGPQKGTRYSAAEIHENILEAAEEELGRPFAELAISAPDC